MSVINRNVTRTIKNTTDTTAETRNLTGDTVAFNLSSSDEFYIGFKKPFSTRYFNLGTANATTNAVTIKYWNGTAFAAVEDVIDQTQGFTQSGFISWENISGWTAVAQTPITDVELYWIELTVDVGLDAGTTLTSVNNLFCDTSTVSRYYPELISDSSYIPSSQTDFMPQLEAAKDSVVLKLKQDKVITDEAQVIDINEVAVATVHAFADIIYSPILRGTDREEELDDIREQFNDELRQAHKSFDFDESGTIEEDEKGKSTVFIARV